MFKRSILNKNKIIIVDGIIGGGKSLICPIISSYKSGSMEYELLV